MDNLRIEIHGDRATGKSTLAAFLEKIINTSHIRYSVINVQDSCTIPTQSLRNGMYIRSEVLKGSL